eukprot:jgi/Hompol1/2965/HPOL_006279-RA
MRIFSSGKTVAQGQRFVDQLSSALLDSPVLSKLKAHQSALHADPAVVLSLCNEAKLSTDELDSHLLNNTLAIVSAYLESGICMDIDEAIGADWQLQLDRVCQFLISVTLKDLSIAIVFTKSNEWGSIDSSRSVEFYAHADS